MGHYPIHRTDANAEDLYALARALGMSVAVIHHPVDIMVGMHGLTVAVEVKTATGQLSPDQQQFLREWRGAVCVWRTQQDVKETAQQLRTQAIRLREGER